MPTWSLRSLCTLILPLLLLRGGYCSFNDVTRKVGISSINGLVAAFGDFNGDKSTDFFVITNQGKKAPIYSFINEASISLNFRNNMFSIKTLIQRNDRQSTNK